jgi:hypothetical protein
VLGREGSLALVEEGREKERERREDLKRGKGVKT